MIFMIINLPNFVYLFIDPGFLSVLNFYEASRFVHPYRMHASDRHNGQIDKQTKRQKLKRYH